LSIQNLTTAVALIPAGPPSTTGDPGLTAAQATAAAAAIDAQTAILTADVAAKPGVPASPVSVTATSAGGGVINLSLPAVPGATGYTLNRSTVTGAEVAVATPAVIPPVGLVTFSDTGLTVGTTYFYTVTALNAAGNSAPSAEITLAA
jgi:hypothetical protein